MINNNVYTMIKKPLLLVILQLLSTVVSVSGS